MTILHLSYQPVTDPTPSPGWTTVWVPVSAGRRRRERGHVRERKPAIGGDVDALAVAELGLRLFVDPLDVDRVVIEKANLKRDVLTSVEGDRHLFVWVHWSAKAVNGLFGDPASDPLELPPWLDEVWVAKLWGHVTDVWHRGADTSWEVCGVAD